MQPQRLDQDDADERLEQFGANQVAHDKAPHALIQLIKAFNNPFIFVLMVLAAISFFTDYWLPRQSGEETELTGVIIILTMVTLSGLLRFWQEYRTNKAAEALKSMVRTTATVLRRSSYSAHPLTLEVPIRELVPGISFSSPPVTWCRPTCVLSPRAICSSARRF